MKKTILLASDHAGFELKNYVRDFLQGHVEGQKDANGQPKYMVEDLGADSFDPEDNYPELIMPAAIRIAEQPEKYLGIIFGKSGQGEAIVANRFPSVRAIVYYGKAHSRANIDADTDLEIIKLGREHNDSNVLSLGADFLTKEQARAAIECWLATPFSDEERHKRRIEMIDNIS